MKKSVLSIVLTVVMLFSLTVAAWAYDPIIAYGQCGDWNTSTPSEIQWVLWDTGKLTISGEGHMENYTYRRGAPWEAYKEQIKEVMVYGKQDELESFVLSIGNHAFRGCVNLTKVTIPDTVVVIGENAFSGCKSLKEITIPDSVEKIGNQAFGGCKSLKEVALPDSLKEISDSLFAGSGIESIEFPAGLTSIGSSAFSKSSLIRVDIPDSVTTIGTAAFDECPYLTYAKLPCDLEIIKMSTFSKCSKLQTVIFPENLKEIGRMAFIWCDELQNFSLPESLEVIGNQAFIDCESLTEVTIPANVTIIEQNSFSGCGKLRAIYVAEGNPAYQSVDGVLMTKDGTMVHTCPGAKEGVFVIPDGATTIESCCFFDCQNLKRLVIPATLTTINERGFDFCDNLLSFYFSGATPEEELLKKMDISSDATLYYLEGQSGWTSPTYLGYKTALWDGSSQLPGTLPAGDANGDGRVGVEDVQQLYGYLTGQNTITIAEKMAADVNNDDEVDVYDLQLLYERLAQGTTL